MQGLASGWALVRLYERAVKFESVPEGVLQTFSANDYGREFSHYWDDHFMPEKGRILASDFDTPEFRCFQVVWPQIVEELQFKDSEDPQRFLLCCQALKIDPTIPGAQERVDSAMDKEAFAHTCRVLGVTDPAASDAEDQVRRQGLRAQKGMLLYSLTLGKCFDLQDLP